MKHVDVFYNQFSSGYATILKFILTQNSIRIAIGMSLGIVLSNTGTKIIKDIIKPLINILLHFLSKTNFVYTIYGNTFNFGGIVEQLITFIIFVIIIYYAIIVPLGKLEKKYNINDNTQQCPYCMTLINSHAIKCPSCTSELIKS